MSGLEPLLVMDEEKRVYVQLSLGQFCARMPLPKDLSAYTTETLRALFNEVVPEMTRNLIAMRNDHTRKMRKKCARGSIELSRKSSEEISVLHPKSSS